MKDLVFINRNKPQIRIHAVLNIVILSVKGNLPLLHLHDIHPKAEEQPSSSCRRYKSVSSSSVSVVINKHTYKKKP